MAEFGQYDALIRYMDANDVEQELGLIFFEQGEAKRSEQLVPLRQVRQDTGQNPDEIVPGLGDYFAQSDFSGGMAQERYHSPGGESESRSDRTKYFKSFGFDISEIGRLSHLKELGHSLTAGVRSFAIGHGGQLFAAESGTAKRTTDLVNWTPDTPAVSVFDMVTSGDTIYSCSGGADGIYRKVGTGAWAQYVTSGTINYLAWLKDRLIAVANDAFYEITASGALPTAVDDTLPSGWSYGRPWENGPFIYLPAYSLDARQSRIHIYGLNSDGTAIISKGSTKMPINTVILSGEGYLETVFLLGRERLDGAVYVDVVYQAFPDDNGFLRWLFLYRAKKAAGFAVGLVPKLEPIGDHILIPWTSLNDSAITDDDIEHAGLLYHNLARDALAHHLGGIGVLGLRPNTVTVYDDKVAIGAADGVYYEADTYVAEATLITSMADFNNAAQKVFDWIDVETDPLPTGTSVDVYYTTEHVDEDTWTLAGTIDTAGSTSNRFYLDSVSSPRFALKFVSNANGAKTLAPVIRSYSVKSDVTVDSPTSVERQISLYVLIASEIRKDEWSEPVLMETREVRDTLWDLAHTQFDLEEPDGIWRVRLTGLADYEPAQPVFDEESAVTGKEAYVMQLQLTGRKTS